MNRAIVRLLSNCNQAFQKFSMDHSFRIALWMFFLIVCLQANPIPVKFNLDDLGLDQLENLKCENNVTFTSPTNVNEEKCRNTIVTHFMEQLKHAEKICDDLESRFNDTLTAFQNGPQFTISAECKLETKRSEFKIFVNDILSFVQQINAGN